MVVPRGGHDECGGTRCVFTFVMIGWRWTDPHYCYIINLITPLGSFIIAIRVAIAPLLTSRHDSTQFLCFFFLFSSSIFSFSLSLSLWDDGDTAETRKKSNRQTWRNWSLKKPGKKNPVKKPVGTSFFFLVIDFRSMDFFVRWWWWFLSFSFIWFRICNFFLLFSRAWPLGRGPLASIPGRTEFRSSFCLLFPLHLYSLYSLSLSLSLSLSVCSLTFSLLELVRR